MQRKYKERLDGEGNRLIKIWLTSDPHPQGSNEAFVAKFQLLQYVANQPDLTTCSGIPFEKLKMYWNESELYWVIEVEATIKKEVV